MLSKRLFRQSGYEIVAHHPLRDTLFTIAGTAAIALVLGWASGLSLVDDVPAAADVSARAFEAGKLEAREEMAGTVRDAYQQGMTDALSGLPEPDLRRLCAQTWHGQAQGKAGLRERLCGRGVRP